MIVIQISDLHIGWTYSSENTPISMADRASSVVEYINCLEPNPDVVVATGDLTANGYTEEYSLLGEILGRLHRPLFLIPGNHDDRLNLRRAFKDSSYLNQCERYIQYSVEDYPLQLIALDTTVPGKESGALDEARFHWFEQRIHQHPNKPTLVLAHHPPFQTGMKSFDRSPFEGADRFAEIVSSAEQIVGILCGHVHRPISVHWAGTSASVCPSTALPFALELDAAKATVAAATPPGCALHKWSVEAGLVSHVAYLSDY